MMDYGPHTGMLHVCIVGHRSLLLKRAKLNKEGVEAMLLTFVAYRRVFVCLFVYIFFNLGHLIRDNTSSLCSSLRPKEVHAGLNIT